MDREISAAERRRRLARRLVTAAIAVAALTFSFAATINYFRPSAKRNDLLFARVERGSIDATLQGSGTIVPAFEQVVSSPVDARVDRIVRRAGDRVRRGDELVALDVSATRLDVDRLAGSLASKQSEQEQLKLKLEDTIASLRAQIDQKKLDGEILRLKAEQNSKLFAEGLVSQQDDLAAKTALKKCEIELAQLADQLARAQRTGDAQLAASRAEVLTLEKERAQSERQLNLAMMKSDRDGIITAIVSDTGAMLHSGDVVARIADLSSFRVDATISDIHAAELSAGMPVIVKLDDATSIPGSIASIEPRIDNGTVKFHVALSDAANQKLRNNVRVDVFPVVGRRTNALRVKRGSLGASEREDVFVVRNGELVSTPVLWGLAGQDYIEPKSGLREGDQVVISNMNDYAGVKTLRLK